MGKPFLFYLLLSLAPVTFAAELGVYTTRQFRSGSCTLQIRELMSSSAKPTFVFVNGIPVTSIIYDRLARKVYSELGASVQLVDLPGTGKSRNSSYTWSASEACLGAYLQSLAKDVVLVVHDIAGPIALPLLADSRLRFEGVVILNTILKPSVFRPVFPLSLIRLPLVGAVVSPLIPPFYFEKEIRSKGLHRNAIIEKREIRRLYRDFAEGFGKSRLHKVMRGFELTPERDARIYRGLQSPVPKLTLWGLSDPSLGGQSQFIPHIKNTEILKFPEAKHFLMLDYADEIFRSIQSSGII